MGFSSYKWSIFFTIYVGYFLYILCRKSFSFAMPTIMAKEGLAKDELGETSMFCSFAVQELVFAHSEKLKNGDFESPRHSSELLTWCNRDSVILHVCL